MDKTGITLRGDMEWSEVHQAYCVRFGDALIPILRAGQVEGMEVKDQTIHPRPQPAGDLTHAAVAAGGVPNADLD